VPSGRCRTYGPPLWRDLSDLSLPQKWRVCHYTFHDFFRNQLGISNENQEENCGECTKEKEGESAGKSSKIKGLTGINQEKKTLQRWGKVPLGRNEKSLVICTEKWYDDRWVFMSFCEEKMRRLL